MKLRVLIAFAAAIAVAGAVAGCGVKSDLVKPNDAANQKNEKDPSKPPSQLGR